MKMKKKWSIRSELSICSRGEVIFPGEFVWEGNVLYVYWL